MPRSPYVIPVQFDPDTHAWLKARASKFSPASGIVRDAVQCLIHGHIASGRFYIGQIYDTLREKGLGAPGVVSIDTDGETVTVTTEEAGTFTFAEDDGDGFCCSRDLAGKPPAFYGGIDWRGAIKWALAEAAK